MTTRTRYLLLSGLLLWALLYLPNLRSNPNWYGDEGEWMDMSLTLVQGTPRAGPVIWEGIFPYSYSPLYGFVTGILLRVFGNDIVVARALGAVTALVAAALLFWIGRRVRDEWLGWMCAVALLVYAQADMNFRWVRSHPLTGTFALASAGFLIRYLLDKRVKDVLWAGGLCSLATATHYYAIGMIPAVIAAAVWVNWRQWRQFSAWRDVTLAAVAAGGFGLLFLAWYLTTQGGPTHLREQVRLLGGMSDPTPVTTILVRMWRFLYETPTAIVAGKPAGKDLWLCAAAIGLVAFPVARLRPWLVVWAVLLMWPVFKRQDNVSWFYYPATIFLPVLALGVGGTLYQAGRLVGWAFKKETLATRLAPAVVMLTLWFAPTVRGATGHFDTMIDAFTQRSIPDAEAAMAYVNSHTTAEDFVLVPKQIYWLVKTPRRSMLSHCGPYEGRVNGAWPAPIPRSAYWFDCRWDQAKYVVIASGVDRQGQAFGIDLLYTRGVAGGQEVVAKMVAERWPVVFPPNAQVIYPPQLGGGWPVLLGGEYLVLANPKLSK